MSDENRKNDANFKASDPAVDKQKDSVNFVKGSPTEYKFYPDNPTSEYHKQKFATKGPSRYYDPCQESANMSIKCLELNNFDRDMCHEYFKAYRECKKEWMRQRRQDTRSGQGGWS